MNIKQNKNYIDERGSIEMILESARIGSISRITTEANHGRASHYHTGIEGHTIIINEGQILIYERPANTVEKPVLYTLNKGDIHWTGPQIEHYMWMPCFTVFDCFSVLPRDSDSYEKSTVRFDHNLREIYNRWKD